MDADVIIVGAGPAGLALAATLGGTDAKILLIERASEAELAQPAYDGREIALTQSSVGHLQRLGAWSRFKESDIAPLWSARVLNGSSPYALDFRNSAGTGAPLGYLVPNSAIRAALFEIVSQQANAEIRCQSRAVAVVAQNDQATVRLEGGSSLTASLVVAADTRFSALRRSQGIPAALHDFGRAMLVCRVEQTLPHGSVATEWFDYGQTMAMLPLNGNFSSLVLTLPERELEPLVELTPEAFAADMERRTQNRWGSLRLDSQRHVYPLVATYARFFVRPRFALVGDAAVGMHPVTAHGFNLGLRGAATLGAEIARSHRMGDAGGAEGLRRYERTHRRATWPLFTATNVVAAVYTKERPAARLVRAAGIRLMNVLAPVRRAVEAKLLEGAGS